MKIEAKIQPERDSDNSCCDSVELKFIIDDEEVKIELEKPSRIMTFKRSDFESLISLLNFLKQ